MTHGWVLVEVPDRDTVAQTFAETKHAAAEYADHEATPDEDRALARKLADTDGRWEFPALFTLEGDLIDAWREPTRYGWNWRVVDGRYVVESTHHDANRSRASNAKRGVYVGRMNVRAKVKSGCQEIVPHRQRWSDVIVTDNGHTVTSVPTAGAVASGIGFHDRLWAMPLVESSVHYVDEGRMVTAVYVADPERDPSEAADDTTWTPFGEFPTSVLIGWAYKHTRADSFDGHTGWYVHDASTGMNVPMGSRKPDAMGALREVAIGSMEELRRQWYPEQVAG